MIRRALVLVALLALAWPTIATADDEPRPPDDTEVCDPPPDDTVPDGTVPTDTVVGEEPPDGGTVPPDGGDGDGPPDDTTVPAETIPPDDTVPDDTLPPDDTRPDDTVPDDTANCEDPVPVETPDGGGRTLTVSPHNSLEHDQTVILRGTGWPSRAYLGAAQCGQGVSSVDGCGPIHSFTTGRLGNFSTTMTVDVILDTYEGTFDCRVDTCVIGANDVPTPDGAQVAVLGFDPSGPDPVRRTAEVDPDTDLVDGQRVMVTGDGFSVFDPRYGGYAELVQCVGDPHTDTCDEGTYAVGRVGGRGHLHGRFDVATILHTEADGTYDCRTGGCTLGVRDFDESLAEAAAVPLGFDPSGPVLPPPTLALEPATDVEDGDPIEATGTGYEPDGFVLLLQCVPGATGFEDCDYRSTGYGEVDDTGALEGYIGARTIMRTESAGRIDCRTAACVVMAAPYESLRRGVEAPLEFDPDGGLLRPRIEGSPTSGLHDGDEVNIRGTGFRPGEGAVVAQCLTTAVDIRDCDFSRLTFLDAPFPEEAAGASVRGTMTVRRVIHTNRGQAVNCRRRHCAIVVIDNLYDGTGHAPRFGIRFAPIS